MRLPYFCRMANVTQTAVTKDTLINQGEGDEHRMHVQICEGTKAERAPIDRPRYPLNANLEKALVQTRFWETLNAML